MFWNNILQVNVTFNRLRLRLIPIFGKRGRFTTYKHLKTDVENLLKQNREKLVTTFVDYFRIPNDVPHYDVCQKNQSIDDRIECLEDAIRNDIGSDVFVPYIQKYEFEALLFSSNRGFEYQFNKKEAKETDKIIKKYPNPEEINEQPNTSPSKRLKNIVPTYSKPLEGNTIALEIGLNVMLEKCPRFKKWIDRLTELTEN